MNLTEAWLMSVVSPDDWESKFKPILSSGTDEDQHMQEMREKWGEPEDGRPGEFILTRPEAKEPVSSNFNMSVAPKPD